MLDSSGNPTVLVETHPKRAFGSRQLDQLTPLRQFDALGHAPWNLLRGRCEGQLDVHRNVEDRRYIRRDFVHLIDRQEHAFASLS